VRDLEQGSLMTNRVGYVLGRSLTFIVDSDSDDADEHRYAGYLLLLSSVSFLSSPLPSLSCASSSSLSLLLLGGNAAAGCHGGFTCHGRARPFLSL